MSEKQAEEALTLAVNWVKAEPGLALLFAAGAYLLLFLLTVVALIRSLAFARRQRQLLRAVGGGDLENLIAQNAETVDKWQQDLSRAEQTGDANRAALKNCFQQVSLLRYNALPETGGEQSFTLALLDGDNNGVVVSGLHGRHDMRVYAKPVVAGTSTWVLTDEEQQAIAEARPGLAKETTRQKGRR